MSLDCKQSLFQKAQKTHTSDFERNNYSFQIPYQNSRVSLVCLLLVLFLFLEYRRLLVYVIEKVREAEVQLAS